MKNKQRKEKGQSLVEFALVLPVLLIILSGVLDLGRLYYVYVVLTDSASEGVAYAISNPPDDPTDPGDPDTAEVIARVQAASSGLVSGEDVANSVEIDCPTCPNPTSGETITVTVSCNFAVMTPFVNVLVPDGEIPLHAVATGSVLSGEFGN